MPGARRRKTLTVVALVGVLAGMGGLTAAAVPLYRLFCQVTGFGGTTQTSVETPRSVSERVVTVRFNADTAGGMPWRFRPLQREIQVRVGETVLVYYEAENLSDETIVGTSTFNVTPYKAGPYFAKVECFCFTEQVLAPGERVEMPVTFFIDPDMLTARNVADVNTITLSYTFFRASADAAPEPTKESRVATAQWYRDVN